MHAANTSWTPSLTQRKCPPGTQSNTGRTPCTSCRPDEYQPEYGGLYCIPCPTRANNLNKSSTQRFLAAPTVDACVVCPVGAYCKVVVGDDAIASAASEVFTSLSVVKNNATMGNAATTTKATVASAAGAATGATLTTNPAAVVQQGSQGGNSTGSNNNGTRGGAGGGVGGGGGASALPSSPASSVSTSTFSASLPPQTAFSNPLAPVSVWIKAKSGFYRIEGRSE